MLARTFYTVKRTTESYRRRKLQATHINNQASHNCSESGRHSAPGSTGVNKMAVSVSKQTNTLEKESISKGVVKRKYLLTDEELEDIHFELVDNPLNKGYGEQMEV